MTREDVLNIIELSSRRGDCQFGGQTPLSLASPWGGGVKIRAHPDSIDRAEDRERFNALLKS